MQVDRLAVCEGDAVGGGQTENCSYLAHLAV